MLEIENTLLTGSISLDSDTDGNIIIMQNRQEIKITPSQAKELEGYLVSLSNKVKFVKIKEYEDWKILFYQPEKV